MSESPNEILSQSQSLEPGVYLLPVTMSDNNPNEVLPQRNIEIFHKIKYFFVENKRTARRFLKKIDKTIRIEELSLVELNEHTSDHEIPYMLEPLKRGFPIGIMSEAGCPGVADPGAKLVELAQSNGFKVIPLVGPSSILLALMGSGMNGQNFTFNGYLPIEDKSRDVALRNMASLVQKSNTTQIFIETPYRNAKLFSRMLEVLPGNIKLCVASDITGHHESIITRTVSAWKKAKYNCDKIPTIFVLGL